MYTAIVTDTRPQRLADALASLQAQSQPPSGITIVGSGRRPEALPPQGLSWMRADGPESAGLLDAVRAARTEYVAFLRASDEWLPWSAQQRLRAIREHPDAALLYTDCFVLPGGTRASSPVRYHDAAPGDDPEIRILGANPVRLSTLVLRRDAVERLGFGSAGPLGWLLAAARSSALVHLPAPTARVAATTPDQRNAEGDSMCTLINRPDCFVDRGEVGRLRARGAVLMRRGMYKEAVAEFEQVINADRSDTQTLTDIGLCLLALTHLGCKVEMLWDPFAKAVALRPDDPSLQYHFFVALMLGGQKAEAASRQAALAERFADYSGLASAVAAAVRLPDDPSWALACLRAAADMPFPRRGGGWRAYEVRLLEEALCAFLERGYYEESHAVAEAAQCGLQLRLAQADIGAGRYLEGLAHAEGVASLSSFPKTRDVAMGMMSFACKAAGWGQYADEIEALRAA